MKYSKKEIHRKTYSLPEITFEQQRLTSFSGLIALQQLFQLLNIKKRLKGCFQHIRIHPIYGFANTIILLIIHLALGYRRIKDLRYYEHDPLVKRVVGLSRLPDTSSISRILANTDEKSFSKCRSINSEIVLDRIASERLNRITADFDGSVQSTKRHAEQTAVGFNKKKKGARSYYPLNCTIAQTGQVLDFLHRPGNVHDSNGAVAFVEQCFEKISERLPTASLESRLDGAFFSQQMVELFGKRNVEFTISVPFLRMAALKAMVEERLRWIPIDEDTSYFEKMWKPDKWEDTFRFIFVRTINKIQVKEAIQLDMFYPCEYEYAYKVIVTNKYSTANNIIAYHNGRGSQEGIFAELKSQIQMDYIPFKRLLPNKFYMLSSVLAHNITHEMQMIISPKVQSTTFKRATLWTFQKIDTIRKNIFIRAGRLTKPGGRLTLTISAGKNMAKEITVFLESLKKAA
jgi:hypothetical protein